MTSKNIEHFTAYFVTGRLFALAYPHPRQLFLIGAGAAVLELLLRSAHAMHIQVKVR
jgi:hypothetical protein